MEKWNPEQLIKNTERIKSDAELLEGANRGRLVQDNDSETKDSLAPRLEISEQTLAKKKAFNEIFGGMFDTKTINAYLQSGPKEFKFIFGKDVEYIVTLSPAQELTIGRWEVNKRLSLNVDFGEIQSYIKEYIKKYFADDIENFKRRTTH